MNTLEKLERKRANARARAKKFYDEHKDKVLGKQKLARVQFSEAVKSAYVENGIPFTKQPVERPPCPPCPPCPSPQQERSPSQEPQPEPQPEPQSGRFILDKKTKKIYRVIDLKFIIDNVGSLKKPDGEFISGASQKDYVNTAKNFFRVFNVDSLNTILKNSKKVIEILESVKTVKGELYSTNSKRHFTQMICKFFDAGWFGKEFADKYKPPYVKYNERLDFISRQASTTKK